MTAAMMPNPSSDRFDWRKRKHIFRHSRVRVTRSSPAVATSSALRPSVLHSAHRNRKRMTTEEIQLCQKRVKAQRDKAVYKKEPGDVDRRGRPPDDGRQQAQLIGQGELQQNFFFLKDPAPPDLSPFPPHNALPF